MGEVLDAMKHWGLDLSATDLARGDHFRQLQRVTPAGTAHSVAGTRSLVSRKNVSPSA